MEEILLLVEKYIEEKNKNTKWRAGVDLVNYAGNYFDSEEYIEAIKSILNGWLVLGKQGIKFEKTFPKLLGKKRGLLLNSGSSANLLMLAALTSKNGYNLPKGTKVITPVAGFPTTINPIIQMGFEPIFVDIELDTLNIDIIKLEDVCIKNPEAKVITFAHVLGNSPDMDKIMAIVKKYDLILLEDCCDALGSTWDGKPLGSFGELASCSFYPAHHITMGEGGFLACNNENNEQIIRSFREWGRGCYCVGKANQSECGSCGIRFNNWLPKLPDYIFDHKYTYVEIGYNLKPIELQAAMGLAQIKKLDFIKEKRKYNHNRLMGIFSKYENYFHLPKKIEKCDPSWFAFAITLKDNTPFKRSDSCQFFEANKIQTRPYFGGNILLQPAYDNYYNGDVVNDFPVATKVTKDTFFLGVSPVITDEQIDYIQDIFNKFIVTYD